MRQVRLVGLVLAVLVGVALILLAQDVRSWHDTLDGNAVRYTAAPLRQLPATASTALPSGLSGSLLSVGNDRQWLESLQAFVATYEKTENLDALGPGDFALLSTAESGLARLTQDHNALRASQAYDLLAVLVFRQAYPGSGVDTGEITSAVIDLQNSIELDPSNELAKENLELALRVAFATHAAVAIPQGAGNEIAPKRSGGTGGPAGEGY